MPTEKLQIGELSVEIESAYAEALRRLSTARDETNSALVWLASAHRLERQKIAATIRRFAESERCIAPCCEGELETLATRIESGELAID